MLSAGGESHQARLTRFLFIAPCVCGTLPQQGGFLPEHRRRYPVAITLYPSPPSGWVWDLLNFQIKSKLSAPLRLRDVPGTQPSSPPDGKKPPPVTCTLNIKMELIVKMKFGSHLYGTATEDSDVDYKGVFLPTKKEILLNNIPKCRSFSTCDDSKRNNPDDVDEEIYSLHYFLKLACDGQTVAMDMLHAPDTLLVESSELWRNIIKQKNRFYTKNLNSFVNYARRQASKYGIKGSRLNAALQVFTILKANNPECKLRDIWTQLPRNEYCHDTGVDPNGMRQYQVCGKTFQESSAIGYVLPIIRKFYDDYGHRAKQAAENRNIDWKAISHALRAAIQTREILTAGTISFPLNDASFLLKVKSGQLDYTTEVAPELESLMDEVEKLVNESALPEKVDVEYWNSFICDALETIRFRMS